MAPKMAVPRVGDLIELNVFAENERQGSIFIVLKKARSRRTLWVKLLACRSTDVVKTRQVEHVPDRNIQIKFGCSAEDAVDRAPGKLDTQSPV